MLIQSIDRSVSFTRVSEPPKERTAEDEAAALEDAETGVAHFGDRRYRQSKITIREYRLFRRRGAVRIDRERHLPEELPPVATPPAAPDGLSFARGAQARSLPEGEWMDLSQSLGRASWLWRQGGFGARLLQWCLSSCNMCRTRPSAISLNAA